jgi:hypothetical protein
MARYRFYRNGDLQKSASLSTSVGKQWLDNTQEEWSKNLMPQVAPGEFDPNNGIEVNRVSDLELLVTTTGGHKLRWVVIEGGQ